VSAKGLIFDIKEFAVFDGPGIRTTVFFKGCPLRCTWCHNPEGLSFERQLMVSGASCTHCGKCAAVCPLFAGGNEAARAKVEGRVPEGCTLCGKCLVVCPLGLRRVSGDEYDADELAVKLLRNADYLKNNGGGFTFSGGEPTAQGEFLLELLTLLRGNHRALETNGWCDGGLFAQLLGELELVLLDVKIACGEEHRRWTGADNGPVLANLERLKKGGIPFIVRVPLMPGVNDGDGNLTATAALLEGAKDLVKVELLPYHKTAGAKYGMAGMEYAPGFDVNAAPAAKTVFFTERGINCSVL
jgi:pyruvate formate lyase activating enzyme